MDSVAKSKCPLCGSENLLKRSLPVARNARICHLGRQVFIIDGLPGLWSRRPPNTFLEQSPIKAPALMAVGKGLAPRDFYRLCSLKVTLWPAFQNRKATDGRKNED
jgi:hypothetical protein